MNEFKSIRAEIWDSMEGIIWVTVWNQNQSPTNLISDNEDVELIINPICNIMITNIK